MSAAHRLLGGLGCRGGRGARPGESRRCGAIRFYEKHLPQRRTEAHRVNHQAPELARATSSSTHRNFEVRVQHGPLSASRASVVSCSSGPDVSVQAISARVCGALAVESNSAVQRESAPGQERYRRGYVRNSLSLSGRSGQDFEPRHFEMPVVRESLRDLLT
jgi:hypothetical protein